MAAFSKTRAYYELVKPGRTVANGMTTLAGFLLAANGHINFALLAYAVGGICLIVASAGAFNNYFDRGIDVAMQRTAKRVLVQGTIPAWRAIFFAAVLGAAGFAILAIHTNLPTVVAGIVGIVDYLLFYGISKRRSKYSTLIGSICGATPIVAGYTAVTGRFDAGALLLFFIMVFWQMPHFYAIGIYRRDDYKAAGLPIWPVKRGITDTKWHMLSYICLFIVASESLSLLGYAGKLYFVVTIILGLTWLNKSLQGLQKGINDNKWARSMFGFSLIVLSGFSAVMAINAWVP